MKPIGRIHYKKGSVFLKRKQFAAVVFAQIEKKLKRYPRVCIDRFGCFEKRYIPGRKFLHQNGKVVKSEPYVKVHFVASLPLKKYINK